MTNKLSQLGQAETAVFKNLRPSKIKGGSASRTNGVVNGGQGALAILGVVSTAAQVGLAIANVQAAPTGQKLRTGIGEAGGMLGGYAGGLVGSGEGLTLGTVAGTAAEGGVPGPGSAIGGFAGSLVGGTAGAMAGTAIGKSLFTAVYDLITH